MRRAIATFVAVLVALVATSFGTPAFADTTIAPNDVLDLQVFGEPTLTSQITVSRDGSIVVPLVGRLIVKGLTATQTASQIAGGLKRYIRDPIVTVSIKNEAAYNILVLGNVKTPGRYAVQPGSRVTDALAAAGGLLPIQGPLPVARVSVNDTVTDVPLEALLRKGALESNVLLAEGSAIYVPSPVTIRVRVLGAVDRPGDVEVNEGDRLAVAVAKAGNSTNANADLNHIRVTRLKTGGGTQVTEVNLYQALEGGDLASDIVLQTDDVVYVPQAKRKMDGFSILLTALQRLLVPF